LKTENKKLQNVIEMHKALFHRLEAENKKLRALLKEVAEDAERILKGGA